MSTETVLVCVTGQRLCDRLIGRGAEVAREKDLPLLVLSVAGNGQNDLGDPVVAEALDYLYRHSMEHGAEMTVLCSPKPQDAIVEFARKHEVRHLIIGEGKPDRGGESFPSRLAKALPQVILHVENAT